MDAIKETIITVLKNFSLEDFKKAVKDRVDIAAAVTSMYPDELMQVKRMALQYRGEAEKWDTKEVLIMFRNEFPDIYNYFMSDKIALKWLDITLKRLKKLIY